ncbi:hypothetical protein CDD83_4592 [Cordyceps sp. RAO-2017]|nr:hypothetical protein CDD83_4592 [Cordyceps sp. RAO-2017]
MSWPAVAVPPVSLAAAITYDGDDDDDDAAAGRYAPMALVPVPIKPVHRILPPRSIFDFSFFLAPRPRLNKKPLPLPLRPDETHKRLRPAKPMVVRPERLPWIRPRAASCVAAEKGTAGCPSRSSAFCNSPAR